MEENTRPPPAVPPSPAQGSADLERSGVDESGVLRLLAEDAKITRQVVQTGRVRVAKVTRTRDHLIDELLARSDVEVKRVPIERLIDAMPPVKEDGDLTVIPIVEETLVVERRLMLKEEVHIRRVQTTERYQQKVELRYQTAEVTRTPANKPATDSDAVVGSLTKSNTEDS